MKCDMNPAGPDDVNPYLAEASTVVFFYPRTTPENENVQSTGDTVETDNMEGIDSSEQDVQP
jgi:hypothetical protein